MTELVLRRTGYTLEEVNTLEPGEALERRLLIEAAARKTAQDRADQEWFRRNMG